MRKVIGAPESPTYPPQHIESLIYAWDEQDASGESALMDELFEILPQDIDDATSELLVRLQSFGWGSQRPFDEVLRKFIQSEREWDAVVALVENEGWSPRSAARIHTGLDK